MPISLGDAPVRVRKQRVSENELVREYTDKYKRELTQARDHSALLLEVNNMLVSNLELPSLFRAISAGIQRVVKHDYSSLSLYDPKQQQFRVHALDFPSGRGVIKEEAERVSDRRSPTPRKGWRR